jgi:hypothetical protein
MIDWYKDIIKTAIKKKEQDQKEEVEIESLEEIDTGEKGYGDNYPKK